MVELKWYITKRKCGKGKYRRNLSLMSVSSKRETQMAENKVVIKINYDKDKNRRPVTEPKMITVWHTRRILAAVLILMLLVVIPIFWFSRDDDQNADIVEKTEYGEKEPSLTGTDAVIKETETLINSGNQAASLPEGNKESGKNSESVKESAKRPPAIIYSKKVIRASLNSGAHDKEPYQPVKLPVKLSKTQTIEVFYFNELRGINDKVLYHSWSKDGQVIDKKQLNINGSRAKVLSSRTLAYKDKGEWQIQLVDRKGKVFSEVNFFVNQE